MRIAITGATGLVGSALASSLRSSGHVVVPISRQPLPGGVEWHPERRQLDVTRLAGVEAVVHLAGENLAGQRWSPARKRQLRESRVPVTEWLSGTLAALDPIPHTMISASAVGIYGSRGDEVLTETAAPGTDFLALLARDWERAAAPARDAGIRVVHPRFGMILSASGGALRKLILPFRLGLGGPMGNGRQWVSWVTLDDTVRALEYLLANPAMAGAVNVAAAGPVRNAEFVRALARALRRPAFIPLPAIALRIALGEMAVATILASQRAVPDRLISAGFEFRDAEINATLARLVLRRA